METESNSPLFPKSFSECKSFSEARGQERRAIEAKGWPQATLAYCPADIPHSEGISTNQPNSRISARSRRTQQCGNKFCSRLAKMLLGITVEPTKRDSNNAASKIAFATRSDVVSVRRKPCRRGAPISFSHYLIAGSPQVLHRCAQHMHKPSEREQDHDHKS